MTPEAMLAMVAGPAALPFVLTSLNVLTWSRGRSTARTERPVSVLIPARNEAATIERCVRAVAASSHPVAEIVVFDDASTDETGTIVDRLAEEIDTLRVVRGEGLPPGWVGKPHACHQLGRHARGEILLFVDADVELTPDAVSRVVSLLERHDVVSAVPAQRMETFAERLVMPLLMLTYTAWLPLFLVPATRDERVVAANGQLIALARESYDAVGGFAAVRQEIVDDVAFCRLAKRAGLRVMFADGSEMASCRMYGSGVEIWEGFSKNLYEGIGASPWALVAVVAMYLWAFVVPYLALAAAWVGAMPSAVPGLVGVAFNVATRALLVARFRHPVEGIVLHPVSVLALVAIAVNSFRWHAAGALRWAGRTYGARASRLEGA